MALNTGDTEVTHEEAIAYIKILLAYIEGKKIQARRNGQEWSDCMWHRFFDFGEINYRVKPEQKSYTLIDEQGTAINLVEVEECNTQNHAEQS